MSTLKETVFITRPTLCFLSASFVLCLLGVTPRPSFLPLALLLACLRLYGRIIACREGANAKFRNTWLVLTAAVVLSHAGPAIHALSTPATSIIFLTLCAATTSAIALGVIFLDIRLSSRTKSPWSQLTLFPALWSSVWAMLAHTSPVGRLATWSPITGNFLYLWTTHLFGSIAIDWLTGAWSVVITETVGDWFIGSVPTVVITNRDSEVDDLLGPRNPAKDQSPMPSIRRSHYVLGLFGILVALTAPSYISPALPLAPYSSDTTPVTVACVLPPRHKWKNGPPGLDDFITESQRLTAAKILLWPEGAVRFDTFQAKAEAIEKVRAKVSFTNHWVGMSFEEVMPFNGINGSAIERRNGFVLVDKTGPVMEYYKRHLVPVAESFSMSPASDPPTIYTLPLTRPKDFTKAEWGNLTRPIPVTASICLDFSDADAFSALPSKPALILAPARTWEISVGLSMFEQAKARAAEIDSMVLWCDGGEGGVSGVVGRGISEVMQVGQGSWMRTIGIQYPFDDRKTFYMKGGEGMALMGMWVLSLAGMGSVGRLVTTRLANWRSAGRSGEEAPLLG
ncbi:hypothetical protein GLOTRDRAFT_52695, partial [Gloeophyllum trabeum ATCC 11539]